MSLLKKPSLLVLCFAICFSAVFMDLFRGWHLTEHNFKHDICHYYAYLPAYFYNNGSMQFKNDMDQYLVLSPKGEIISKVTYGMSALYSPFFLLAHKIAINQKSLVDGFSEPYSTCIHWGSIFYSILGLFFLRQFLIKYFEENVTAFVMLLVFFGTNLFAYTYSFSEMAHGYLFMLFSALLYLSNTFYEKASTLKFVLLGLLLGFISLIRPIDILISLVFFLWNVSNTKELKERFMFYLTNYRSIITFLIVVLIWLPQCLFWKTHFGSYFYFSYEGEKFFWTDPQIVNILFSFRKGWLLYTPMALLAIIGFFFMKSQHGKMRWSMLAVMLIAIYIYSCWWDWIFGGGFSGRTFVPYYAMLAIPLASFVKWAFSNTVKNYLLVSKLIVITAMFFFACLNIGQTYQIVHGGIHYSAMTKKAYEQSFCKYALFGKAGEAYWGSLKEVNYKDLSSGANRNQ